MPLGLKIPTIAPFNIGEVAEICKTPLDHLAGKCETAPTEDVSDKAFPENRPLVMNNATPEALVIILANA